MRCTANWKALSKQMSCTIPQATRVPGRNRDKTYGKGYDSS
jgi:hypothetical protein